MTKPIVISALFAALFALPACQCKQSAPEVVPTVQPAAEEAVVKPYYALPGLKHGLMQSPVNILSGAADGEKHQIAVNLHHAEPKHLKNKGTTIELEFPEGSSITFDGKEYQLKQMHFHTPSEHEIDGVRYPMEVHVVNSIEPKNPDEPSLYLVMAFLYRMGEEEPFITSFLDQVPSEKGGEDLPPGKVRLSRQGKERPIGDYYHYQGSLTTPPYTETVQWLVQKEILQASPEQIRRINLIEGDNARHVQAMYGRGVDE